MPQLNWQGFVGLILHRLDAFCPPAISVAQAPPKLTLEAKKMRVT